MRTLIAKEIRLLLPAFAAALALAVLPVWVAPASRFDPALPGPFPGYLFCFGILLLTLSSFGREIGLKTLPFILAQPVERARIWRTKVVVLTISMGMAFIAFWVSDCLCSDFRGARFASSDVAISALMVATLTAGGLWTTLVLRQVVAAFWLTFLIPIAMAGGVEALGGNDWIIGSLMGLYSIAGFFLAKSQFLHLQDTAWTGGVITFGGARGGAARSALREHRPWAALFWKELQLQQFTLAAMGGLLVLHLGAVALRRAGAHSFGRTTLLGLELFGSLWLFVPVLAGSQSVAEERKLGTMGAALCLPILRGRQWLLKFSFLLVFGGVLSATLFSTVEKLINGPEFTEVIFPFLFLALAGFYGSTLTTGIVQALAATGLTLTGLWASLYLPNMLLAAPGFDVWQGNLLGFIALPVVPATLLWLSYRNFWNATENWSMWRRNGLVLAGMLVLLFGLTTAIYHRAWEWLTPLEPPHGPARFSLEKPPVLHSYGGVGLAALLPDGRLWTDRLASGPNKEFLGLTLGDKWMSMGGNEFAPGSNWVGVVINSRETAAIRSDGTLWVSEKPRPYWDGQGIPPVEEPAGLVQLGHDSDLRAIARRPEWAMLLLKRDGTLWELGTNEFHSKLYQRSRIRDSFVEQEQPGLRSFQPRRFGTSSDWATLLEPHGWGYPHLWKTDGTAWALHYTYEANQPARQVAQQVIEPGIAMSRIPALDNVRLRSFEILRDVAIAGIRDDGTLWLWNRDEDQKPVYEVHSVDSAPFRGPAPLQIGKESNWVEATGSFTRLVARKTDGSLWTFSFDSVWRSKPGKPYVGEISEIIVGAPIRLGTHSDWAGLAEIHGQIVSLAADGSLWCWPDQQPVEILPDENSSLRIAASRKPVRIENIFGAGE